MKHLLIAFMALFLFSVEAKSQTYEHVFVDTTDNDGSLKIEYNLDSSKILHFKITAQSNYPFMYDQNTYENQVVFLLTDNLEINYYFEFNENDFPSGSASVKTGTLDLSAYTTQQISQFVFEGRFEFKFPYSEGHAFKAFYKASSINL